MSGNYDLVGWAVAIISNVDGSVDGADSDWPHQTYEWRQAARKWLDAAAADGEDDG